MEVLIRLACQIGVGTVIGAVILRAAVALYNRASAKKEGFTKVADPPFGEAMLIVFVAALINAVLGFAIGLLFAKAVAGGGALVTALTFGVGLVAQLVVISLMVQSRWNLEPARAWAVSAYYFVVSLVVAVAIGLIVALVGIVVSLS